MHFFNMNCEYSKCKETPDVKQKYTIQALAHAHLQAPFESFYKIIGPQQKINVVTPRHLSCGFNTTNHRVR